MIIAKQKNAYGFSSDQGQEGFYSLLPIERGCGVCIDVYIPAIAGRKYFSFFSRERTVVGALGTGGGTLVARVARDTHDCGLLLGQVVVS